MTSHGDVSLFQKVWRGEKPFIAGIFAIVICYVIEHSTFIGESGSFGDANDFILIFVFAMIIWNAMSISNHAEMLAERLGEPYGTMILTLSAITVEVIMVATMMMHGDADPQVARDTIYATLMILLNLLIGLTLFLGGIKYGEQRFNMKSSKSYLSMIFILVGIGLIFPNTLPNPNNSTFLAFLGIQSIVLYGFFLKMQSGRLSYFFVHPKDGEGSGEGHHKKDISLPYHFGFLVLTLITVSILAEFFATTMDTTITYFGAPQALAGLITAVIILTPEGVTAVRAALNNEMQRVINIVLGSSLSTVALTIPAVLLISAYTGKTVTLALPAAQVALLVISLLISSIAETSGETSPVEGLIQLSLFAAFLVLIFI